MTRICVTVLLWGLCNLGFANPDAGLKKGMPFTQVRAHLLSQRWKPVESLRTEHLAVDRALVEQRIVEVESCTVDSFCIFRYTKGTKCLKVIAQGESLHDLFIVSWDLACPAKITQRK